MPEEEVTIHKTRTGGRLDSLSAESAGRCALRVIVARSIDHRKRPSLQLEAERYDDQEHGNVDFDRGAASTHVSRQACSSIGWAKTALKVIARNVSGGHDAERLGRSHQVESLMPVGVDPHTFEPAPADVTKVADSDVIVINGAGLEEFLDKLLKNAGGQHHSIEASAGLTSRQLHEGEITDPDHAGDPHFFLDPNNVIKYVENIRDGLTKVDPEGAATSGPIPKCTLRN
jgi:hypothetical protein